MPSSLHSKDMFSVELSSQEMQRPEPSQGSGKSIPSQASKKCTQFGKYKKLAEDKIAIAEANINKAVAECNAVIAVHEKLSAEKNELVLALQSGGSAVQVN